MIVAEKTLDDYYQVQYPRDRLVMRLADWNEDANSLTIEFPSWHDKNRVNLCHYFIDDKSQDFCLCDGALKYHKRCWHLAYRPIVLKAFMNRKEGDNEDWLTHIELYGAHSVEKIAEYIRDMLWFQAEVSQVDILDLELIDYKGELVDRRRIGAAFLKLYRAGEIKPLRQVVAQYAKRKGGKVYVWGKA